MTASLQPRVIHNAPIVKVAAAYGRLYVSGSHAHLLRKLPGATMHERTRSIQLSLTLDSLRGIRRTLGVDKARMASYCTPEVLRWAKAAGTQERQMTDLHARIAAGYRADLPWADTRAGTVADANANELHVEWVNGVRVWKYRAPFEHQKVMATVATELDGAAFLCEQGTGKTRAALEAAAAKVRAGLIDVVLVLCPRGVMNTWQRETRWWAPSLTPVQLRDSIVRRREYLQHMVQAGQVLILNYDVLADLQEAIVAMCGSRRVMMVCDEMHRLRNAQTLTAQAAMEVCRHVAARLGQTGTPVANGAQDVWSQWYVVDLGQTFGANFVQFRREFFTEYSWSWSIEPQEGALDRIGQKMRLRGLRYRKEDCLDLPPKVYEVEEVEMGRDQAQAYEEMKRWLVAWLRGERSDLPADAEAAEPGDSDEDLGPLNADGKRASAANQLVAILRLTQITSGFVTAEDGAVHAFTPNPKLKRMEELVREHVRHGRQVIVWAHYKNDINAILDTLRDLPCVRIDGSQTGKRGEIDRDLAESTFMNGTARVLVANPAAGGVGLNLQAGSVAIYYSQTYSLINRLQSEDRCHRSGSEIHNKVTYIDLVCTGSIDETVREALAGKKDVADAVVDLKRALGV